MNKSPIRNPRLHFYMLVYGMSQSAVNRLGGTAYLDSLADEVRNVLINQWRRYKVTQDKGRGITV